MNKIYLNNQLKKYYLDCLEKEIDLKNIDNGIIRHLRLISTSKNLRPIFSKKGTHSISKYLHSYLNLAYTSNIEIKLMSEIIPHFVSKYDSNNKSEFIFFDVTPKINQKREITKENKGSEWLVNQEYFNVNQIKFELKKGTSEIHDNFWNELGKVLSKE